MQSVKIPQEVRIEDKLIGPLSLRQLILIGVGSGMSYTLYASLMNSVGFIPLSAHAVIWLPAILAVAFALVRINDISLFRYALLVIEMLSKPRRRVWQPRQGLVINIQTHSSPKKKAAESEAAPVRTNPSPLRLQDLSVLLDREGHGKASSGDVTADSLERNVDNIRSSPR